MKNLQRARSFIVLAIALGSPSKARATTELTPREIAKKGAAAFVTVTTFDSSGTPLALGSGFFIRPNLIVTNFHVVKGSSTVLVYSESGGKTYKPRSIAAASPEIDLALLETDKNHPKILELGNSDALEIGEKVYALGNPEGLEQTFSEGLISGKRGQGKLKLLQTTAPISSGSSGGPLMDSNGRVVGVTTAMLTSGQNLNFAVPAQYIEELLTAASSQQKNLLVGTNPAATSYAVAPVQLTSDVRLVDHWFFVGTKQEDGTFKKFRTRNNSVKDEQIFGCQLLYSTRKPRVNLRGILKGPGPLKEFNAKGFKMSVSADQKEVTAEQDLDSKSGVTGVFWGIGPNDPRGVYDFECLLEGRSVVKQTFVVQASPRSVSAATPFTSGYEKARWGMSLAKVRSLYAGGANLPLQNGEITYGVIRPVAGYSTGYLLFSFSDNRLNEVTILFPSQGSEVDLSNGRYDPPSATDGNQIYSVLLDRLSTKYGSLDQSSKPDISSWIPGNGDIVTLSKHPNNTVSISYRKLPDQKDLLKGL